MKQAAAQSQVEAKPCLGRAALFAAVREAAEAIQAAATQNRRAEGGRTDTVRWGLMALTVAVAADRRRVEGVALSGARRAWPRRCARAVEAAYDAASLVSPGSASAALGAVYETLLSLPREGARAGVHDRKRAGAYFTPGAVVEHLLDMTLERGPDVRVCDPACGCGNFLVAAAMRIGGKRGLRRAIRTSVFGMDKDPLAVEVCRAALRIEAGDTGLALDQSVVCGDALLADWASLFPGVFARRGGFDAVVGNPPFLNQLAKETVAGRDLAAQLRERFPGAVGAYTDPAALFLLAAVQITRPGGRASLVLPQSVLAIRDAAGVRDRVLERGSIESLWLAGERVFDAGVMVCAPTIRIGARPARRVARFRGLGFERTGSAPPAASGSWANLAAVGVPDVAIRQLGTLGAIAKATADFRDQYYGLRGCVVEDTDVRPADRRRRPPLITTGLIDPAHCRWREHPTRFDRRAWAAPRVDLDRLGRTTSLAPWAAARLVPKVLLATQTRALEAVVDALGQWIPAVPVITVVPREKADLWRVAAVLLSPVATAWAARHHGSAGLSSGAIKLSAKQAMDVPLPGHGSTWDQAASLVKRAMQSDEPGARSELLHEAGMRMNRAYAVALGDRTALLAWWASLLHTARRA